MVGPVVSVGRIIEGPSCIDEGVAWLCKAEPRFTTARDAVDQVPLRRRPEGFAQLLSAIVSQQVSTASAAAFWSRMEAAGLTEPAAVSAAGEDGLRAVGLSRQKIRYAQALAEAGIDYDALRVMPDADVMEVLVAVPGIGRWTAEIYAMFSLGRADVFAPGDLALQEATRVLFEFDHRPREAAFRRMAEDWSPWRGVAARLLWAYYRVVKQREGIAT